MKDLSVVQVSEVGGLEETCRWVGVRLVGRTSVGGLVVGGRLGQWRTCQWVGGFVIRSLASPLVPKHVLLSLILLTFTMTHRFYISYSFQYV